MKKKVFLTTASAVLALGILTACGGQEEEQPVDSQPIESPAETPVEEPADAPIEEPAEAPTDAPLEEPTEEPADGSLEEPSDATEEPTDDASLESEMETGDAETSEEVQQ